MPKFRAAILLALLLAAGGSLIYLAGRYKTEALLPAPARPAAGYHYAYTAQAELYSELVSGADVPAYTERVYGGIVSHHFYMEKEIADFFLRMRSEKPEVIVIISPNHFGAGKGDVLTSRYGYNTPWGNLEPNNHIVDQLVSGGAATVEERPFEQEHGISTLVGFIKKVFPDTTVVPVIFRRGTPREKVDALAAKLNDILPDRSLVIGSVDFSHHLDRDAADFHDAQSVSAILTDDIDRVNSLEIDSPASIQAVLEYMGKRQALRVDYKNINQAYVSGNSFSDDVTSYLFAHFLKGDAGQSKVMSVLYLGGASGHAIQAGDLDGMKGPEGNFLRGSDSLVISNAIGQSIDSQVSTKAGAISVVSANQKTIESTLDLIRDRKKAGDYVFVSGQQFSAAVAHQLVDAGADVVVGSAGGIKPPEIYRDKTIFYDTGNLFGSKPAAGPAAGYALGIVFEGNAQRLYLFPYSNVNGKPQLLLSKPAADFCNNLLGKLLSHDGCALKVP